VHRAIARWRGCRRGAVFVHVEASIFSCSLARRPTDLLGSRTGGPCKHGGG
jgi:hypothetical protein